MRPAREDRQLPCQRLAARRTLGPEAQAEYDRLVAQGYQGHAGKLPALTREERKQAKQTRREETARGRQERANLAAA